MLKITLLILLCIPTIRALLGAPWAPTPRKAVLKMLKAARLKPQEKLYDFGCGDGRIVHAAAKHFEARAIGLELSPPIYLMAKFLQLFKNSKARILFRDFYSMNIRDADVITCYLLPETNTRIQKKLQKELKKGARIVSYAFQFKNWKEIQCIPRNRKDRTAPIWIYKMGISDKI